MICRLTRGTLALSSTLLQGAGEFPCVHCSRHFISKPALDTHLKTKLHKRRLKELKDKPYSQEEADAAAGLGRDTRKRDSSGNVIKDDSEHGQPMKSIIDEIMA